MVLKHDKQAKAKMIKTLAKGQVRNNCIGPRVMAHKSQLRNAIDSTVICVTENHPNSPGCQRGIRSNRWSG